MTKETPLMSQYAQVKAKYPDVLLLFRVGDFYETFNEDAKVCSKVLGITLTKRSNGAAGETPLAGFPYHSVETYLPKLIAAGLRVAICEQMEDPKMTKTLVKRDVVEVVTPGVTVSDKLLDHKTNNFLAAWVQSGNDVGIAFTDVSTGEFFAYQGNERQVSGIIDMFQPKELLVPKRLSSQAPKRVRLIQTERDDWIFTSDYGKDALLDQFKTHSLKSFGLEEMPLAIACAGGIIYYLKETQKDRLSHIRKVSIYHPEDYIVLDPSTKRNLELTASLNDGHSFGTLISVIDSTQTAMGGRLLKRWVFQPLKHLEAIQRRLNATDMLVKNSDQLQNIRSLLSECVDLERLVVKVSMNKILPRELVQLKNSLKELPIIKQSIEQFKDPLLETLYEDLNPLPELIEQIEKTIVDDPPAQLTDGGIIKSGFSDELDELRLLTKTGKSWITALQQDERIRTGIPSLKINFNNVFGYYIEITKTHLDRIPDNYIRKQTLVNAERFITPELKEKEEKLLTAEDRMLQLESDIFQSLRTDIQRHQEAIQKNAGALAILDCICNYAFIARKNNYRKPIVDESSIIEIKEGRHPVIEHLLPPGESYIPNDTYLSDAEQIHIITGPNMSGKSSYLRQVGLITLMAQIGSFVPAESATIGMVDRIFTRVGASDNLAAGESTFLVEMNETAHILNHATSRSLILLDEIGRGTSTYDGLSIAWSLCEYLHQQEQTKAKTLFATHYHELNALALTFQRIRNYNVEVREYQDKVIFLRKIIPGGADHSYGIQVAQMAGLPEELIIRAKEILFQLESGESVATEPHSKSEHIQEDRLQLTLFEIQEAPIIQALLKVDINRMAPVEALLKLSELISMAKSAMKK